MGVRKSKGRDLQFYNGKRCHVWKDSKFSLCTRNEPILHIEGTSSPFLTCKWFDKRKTIAGWYTVAIMSESSSALNYIMHFSFKVYVARKLLVKAIECICYNAWAFEGFIACATALRANWMMVFVSASKSAQLCRNCVKTP